MSDQEEEVARLARAREKADRSYNDALTALDRAITPRVGLPNPPADVDDQQVQSLNDHWRLLPEGDIDLGTGWRRRLSGIAWRLVGPILQSQQRFNALLVEHLNRNIGGERESRRAATAVITALDRHLKTLALFQDRLLQYLQQITLYVHSKDQRRATPAPDLDAYKHIAFENRFRGSREDIIAAAKLPRATLDNAVAGETSAGAAVRALAETFNQHVDRLNGLIHAEQDYAAIARHA